MSIVLEIPDQLAAKLQTLADAQGVPVDEVGRRALMLGLDALTAPASNEIIDLGPLTLPTHAPGQAIRMSSPIIAVGPVRPMEMMIIEPSAAEVSGDAH